MYARLCRLVVGAQTRTRGLNLWMCVASAGNQIGDEGAKALADALKTNVSIKMLDIDSEYGGRRGEGSREGRDGRESSGPFRDRASEKGDGGEDGDALAGGGCTHALVWGMWGHVGICLAWCKCFDRVWMESPPDN